jgi:hypothetical protein
MERAVELKTRSSDIRIATSGFLKNFIIKTY